MSSPYESASEKVQQVFVEIATKAGWPQEIIDKVKVRIGPNSLDFEHDAEIEHIVQNLEYGNFAEPPTAVFRKVRARVGRNVTDATIQDLLTDKLIEAGLI